MYRIKSFIKKPEVIFISFILVFRVVNFFCLDYNFTPDSYEYIARNGFSWLQGSIDRYRLPVYPMIIDICKFISDEHFAFLVCFIQLIASLLSIIILYMTIKRITNKKWICLFITFLYGTLNATTGWDKTLLTESLSLSLTVFIVFGIVSFIKSKNYKYVVFTTICLLTGCFLRAIFVIYAGLFFGFLLLITILPARKMDSITRSKQRKVNAICSVTAVVPIVLVFVYAFMFNAQYGGFTISDSALGQQLYVVIANDFYKDSTDIEIKEIADSIVNSPSESSLSKNIDSFFKEYYNETNVNDNTLHQIKNELLSSSSNKLDKQIENSLNQYIYDEYQNEYDCSFTNSTYLARLYIMENFDRDRVKKFVNEAKSNYIKSYIMLIPSHTFESFSSYSCVKNSAIAHLVSQITNNLPFFLTITLLHSLLVSMIELLSFVIILLRKKKADWMRLGLGVFILSTILLSIFGTNAEFARTAITALPFMFVAFAIYIEWFSNRIINTLC